MRPAWGADEREHPDCSVSQGLSRLLRDLKPERAYEVASGNANNQSVEV
jgi:hypothetical protein